MGRIVTKCPQFCVCDSCARKKAKEHRAADAAVGSKRWRCACGTCERVREMDKRRAEAFSKLPKTIDWDAFFDRAKKGAG